MIKDRNTTAILFFTHDPETEVRYKCFSDNSNHSTNRKIAESLIHNAKNVILKSKIPYFIISTELQQGDSFGERLANAIQTTFDKGFDKVIVTGNDSPNLTPKTLKNAESKLEQNEIVIGPTTKGGTYLIGLTKKSFNKKLFVSLSWQTSHLLNDLIGYTKFISANYSLINFLDEINDHNDVLRYIRLNIRNKTFSRLLSSIINFNKNWISKTAYCFTPQQQSYFFGIKAPPLIS